jgi:hypothetical protein
MLHRRPTPQRLEAVKSEVAAVVGLDADRALLVEPATRSTVAIEERIHVSAMRQRAAPESFGLVTSAALGS